MSIFKKLASSEKLTKLQLAEAVKRQSDHFKAIIQLADMISDLDSFERDYQKAKVDLDNVKSELHNKQEELKKTKKASKDAADRVKGSLEIIEKTKTSARAERVEILREANLEKDRIITEGRAKASDLVHAATDDAKEVGMKIVKLREKSKTLDKDVKEKQAHLDQIIETINNVKQSALDGISEID